MWVALLILLLTACSQHTPFPETQQGSTAITDVVFELTDTYPELVAFSANAYSASDQLLRIGIRFEENKTPLPSTQQKIFENLLNDIAVRAQEPDWKALFRDIEIDFVGFSKNGAKDEEILLAKKKKYSAQVEMIQNGTE